MEDLEQYICCHIDNDITIEEMKIKAIYEQIGDLDRNKIGSLGYLNPHTDEKETYLTWIKRGQSLQREYEFRKEEYNKNIEFHQKNIDNLKKYKERVKYLTTKNNPTTQDEAEKVRDRDFVIKKLKGFSYLSLEELAKKILKMTGEYYEESEEDYGSKIDEENQIIEIYYVTKLFEIPYVRMSTRKGYLYRVET